MKYVSYDALEKLHESIPAAKSNELLTVGNPKTMKNMGEGYLTGILHLAPARLAGFETCSGRTDGCTAACLNTAGIQGKNHDWRIRIVSARIRKTKQFREDRVNFMQQLEREIFNLVKRAEKHGLKPAIRLNGTSDIPWENVKYQRKDGSVGTIIERFPNVQFYDYTKIATRFSRPIPANYDLTFSAADGNDRAVEFALNKGARVAMVFRNREKINVRKWDLPTHYNGIEVVDADKTDLRFLEKSGVICGLRAKGNAKIDTTGFVRDI